MELTKEEIQTIKDCLDMTLTLIEDEKSLLRGRIVKLLDKIELM